MAWTEITRPKYQRDGLRYASDTGDAEWAVIEPHLPPPARRGRTRETNLRDVVDAIFYIAQSGCQWRLLPKDFPPYTTVQRYFYAWRDNGVWQTINHVLLMDVRHPLQPFDQQMLEWALQAAMPVHVLLTKADKLKRGAAGAALLQVRAGLRPHANLVSVQLFSALKHDGHEGLIAVLDAWLTDGGELPGPVGV